MTVSPGARRCAAWASILPLALTLGVVAGPAGAAPRGPDDLKLTTALPRAAEEDGGLASGRRGDKLGQHDRRALSQALAAGKKTVTVLIATKRGAAPEVARRLAGLEGSVGYRHDKLGYVRAVVPVDAVEKAAKLSGIVSVDLNQTVSVIDPRPAVRSTARARVPAPGAKTPDSNPYLPTNEIGSTDFKRAHPTWDGRGVRIGILDSGVDLDHPALQTTSTGQRKVVDWVTATDPLVDGDASWRPMITPATGPRFTAFDRTWTAPAGNFLVARFAEQATAGSEFAGDVNRDGDTSDTWGILYRASDHAIWVDVDSDGDFTDEELRRPYAEDQQVGHLGTDNPATAVQETVPFVVQYREDVDLAPAGRPGQKADFVNVGIVADGHGSHVAGITAANGLFGGAMDGAAPGAQIVSARACRFDGGCTTVGTTEGMIDLVLRRRVDVVNMSIGGAQPLNDGNTTQAEIYNRLIEDYGVQIVISAGNSGPGLNTVGSPAVTSKALAVAAGLSRATALANYGAVTSRADRAFPFSSRGPREDGGLKPDLSAPGSAISSTPLWLPGDAVPETGYQLPPGYSMYNGTSMSSPQVAGGAALLLSAGRAKDIPVTPAQLRTALKSSAAYDPTVPAAAQGVGEVRVVQAWRLLERDSALVPGQIEVSAPVCTPLSGLLANPDRGAGLYNRCAATQGGQRAGTSKTYTVTLTRRGGSAASRVHTLRWLGNDGTFSAPSTVKLARGKAVAVKVRATPRAGAHSAVLKVDDAKTPGTDGYLAVTVVASTVLGSPSYAASFTGRAERLNTTSYFVTVPEGTQSLKVHLSGVAAGNRTRFLAFNPYGLGADTVTPCYDTSATCGARVRSYAQPVPGVWEIAVEASRASSSLQNPFTLTTEVQSVTVDPAVTTLDSVAAAEPVPLTWRLTNRAAPVAVVGRGGPLGSASQQRPTIARGATESFEVVVPARASRLDVSIGSPSDLQADLDLQVLRGGTPVAVSADGDSEESVSIPDPEPGTYTVNVVGFEVPSGRTAYDYRDAFFAAALGTLDVPARPLTLGAGRSATMTGSLTARAIPAAGRELTGALVLTDEDGGVVGGGTVVVGEVTGQ